MSRKLSVKENVIVAGILSALAFGAIWLVSVPYHAYKHFMRAGRVERAKHLSEVEKKPFSHWLCLNCRSENKHAKKVQTPDLGPSVTQVTIKPVSCSSKVQQIILETPNGLRTRYIPKSDNEIKIATPKGIKKIDLQPPVIKRAEENKTAQNRYYIVNGPMSALRDLYQNTRS